MNVPIEEEIAALRKANEQLGTRILERTAELAQIIRESEEHFRFLNDLAEATRTLADPEQIMAVMSRMLGEHLRASRCAYADVEKTASSSPSCTITPTAARAPWATTSFRSLVRGPWPRSTAGRP